MSRRTNGIGRGRAVVLAVLVLAGLTTVAAAAMAGGRADQASAILRDADGAAAGTARLVEQPNGKVRLTVSVQRASPGLHGTPYPYGGEL